MKDLTDRVAFVTGGSSGIGLALAKAFLATGMRVAIAGRDSDRLRRAEETLDNPDRLLALNADASDRAALASVADKIEARFGRLHLLVNNAGIGAHGPIANISDDEWRRVLEVNLYGVLHGIQVFLPRIQRHGEAGHIVNVGSMTGMVPIPGMGHYCVSKAAVVMTTELLRRDLADTNIGVSLFIPWIVDTPIFYRDLDPFDHAAIAARREAMAKAHGNSLTDPDQVAQMVVDGIRRNEFYIFNDPIAREMLQGRIQEMYEAIDRQFPEQGS